MAISDEKDEEKLFKKEKTLFQKQINEALTDRDNVKVIEDIVKLLILKDSNRQNNSTTLVEVYNYFGLEDFVNLIDIMNGKTVRFPEVDEFKELVKVAISYYYKYIRHKSWNDIKNILKDDTSNSYIKYGINCSKLNRFITELSEYERFSRESKKDGQ